MSKAPVVRSGMALCALGVPLLLVSCGGGANSSSAPPPNVPTIDLRVSVSSNGCGGFDAAVRGDGDYSDGSSQALRSVTWSTSVSTVAKVSTGGLVTTLKTGTITVTAT